MQCVCRWGQRDAKYMQLFVILSIDRFVKRYAVIYELVKLDASHSGQNG